MFSVSDKRPNTTQKQKARQTMNKAREITYSGDYLLRHSDKFVQPERQFQPRTLKKNGGKTSWLSRSRNYAPPMVRRRNEEERKEEMDEKEEENIVRRFDNIFSSFVF